MNSNIRNSKVRELMDQVKDQEGFFKSAYLNQLNKYTDEMLDKEYNKYVLKIK